MCQIVLSKKLDDDDDGYCHSLCISSVFLASSSLTRVYYGKMAEAIGSRDFQFKLVLCFNFCVISLTLAFEGVCSSVQGVEL